MSAERRQTIHDGYEIIRKRTIAGELLADQRKGSGQCMLHRRPISAETPHQRPKTTTLYLDITLPVLNHVPTTAVPDEARNTCCAWLSVSAAQDIELRIAVVRLAICEACRTAKIAFGTIKVRKLLCFITSPRV